MKSKLSLISLAVMVAAGCGIMPESKKIDYKTTVKAPSLEVPPDLTQLPRDDRYAVPGTAGGKKGSTTYSTFTQNASKAQDAGNPTVLPKVDIARMERSGNQRWLVVKAPANKIWDTVKEFWQETGFIIDVERPEAGVMETDWNENRAKIPDDFIRNSLGKILDSLYSTGERDKFRTRLEPGADAGTTEIYISHRGMEEVYSSAQKDQTRWQPRPPDPELEAELLRRLMVRLGTEEKRAEAAVAMAATQQDRAALVNRPDGSSLLEVKERFDRAWRRVGLALDRVGFTVEDRDRAKGLYFVRYVDPDAEAKKGQKSLGDKLAFWRSSAPESKLQYRISVKDAGNQSAVQVVTAEGTNDNSDVARKIIGLLHEQLR